MGYEKEGSDILSNQRTISDSDLYEVRLRCGGELERVEALNREERVLLEHLREGQKQGFQMTVWKLEGIPNTKKFKDNMEAFVRQRPELRTRIIYQGVSKPVRVVCGGMRPLLKLVNLSGIEEKQRKLIMQNVIVAESRRIYNPQTDSVLKMVGFLTGSRHIELLISVYPHLALSFNLQEMLAFVFTGMKPAYSRMNHISKEKVEKLNQDLVEKCIHYWREELSPVGEAFAYSKHSKSSENKREDSLYKVFPEQLAERTRVFSREQGCSQKAVYLAAWAELLGRQYGVQEPVLCVYDEGERLHLFPIKIRRGLQRKERLQDIDRQLNNTARYSACTFEELCRNLGIREDHFQVVYRYIEFQDEEEMNVIAGKMSEMETDENDFCMVISSYLFDSEIRVNYSYSQGHFYDVTVERLHEAFLKLLEEQVSEERKEFNLREYIELEEDAEEKYYRLQTAQKALYLQEAGLFAGRSVEEMMAFAEKTRLQCYSLADVLLEEGQPVLGCAILAEGNIEESRSGTDGIVKSVTVKKAGECFGLEGLLENNITGYTYSVVSEGAKVLWLERAELIRFLNEEPENWKLFLEASVKETNRMKRLWTVM